MLCFPKAAARAGDLREYLAGVTHSPLVWAVDAIGPARQEVFSGLEFTEDCWEEFCTKPGDGPCGRLGVVGLFPSTEATPPGTHHPCSGVTLGGEGEFQSCEEDTSGDSRRTCLAGVVAAGDLCRVSRVSDGVRGVQGNLLGVALEGLGDFQEHFLGVCRERGLFQCLNIITHIV